MKYERIISYVCEQPWAILPEKLQIIADIITMRAAGQKFTAKEIEARIGKRRSSGEAGTGDGGAVAVVPIMGLLCHRMDMFSDGSGGTSTERVAADIQAAAADKSVKTIVLDIDSEGGVVEGIPELFDVIFKARAQKRIVAVANSLAASAAYWLASAADEIVVTPSGSVGSIGVLNLHMEQSKALEKAGIAVTITSAGKYKTDGNPFEPMSDSAKEHITARINEIYGTFVRAVAKGRGVKIADVENGFGQGRVLSAKEAKKAGMVDRIATMESTISRHLVSGRSSSGLRACGAPRTLDQARRDIDYLTLKGFDPCDSDDHERREIRRKAEFYRRDLEFLELGGR